MKGSDFTISFDCERPIRKSKRAAFKQFKQYKRRYTKENFWFVISVSKANNPHLFRGWTIPDWYRFGA